MVDKQVMPYFKIKDEIGVIDGIFFKNKQVLIPQTLRKKMLCYLHESQMPFSVPKV